MVKAAAGAMAWRALKGRRGRGRAGVGGGGAEGGCEDSVMPAGPRGWERRAPMLARWMCVLLCEGCVTMVTFRCLRDENEI